MKTRLKIALAQINPLLGDLNGNLDKVRAAREAASDCDLLVCPELVVSGYPPEDLILRPEFARASHAAVEAFAKETADGGPAVVLTTSWHKAERREDPRPIELGQAQDPRPFNACMLIENGEIRHRQFKMHLPNYGVFDEPRTFRAGDGRDLKPFEFMGVRLGFLVCEDMWYAEPTRRLVEQGVDLLIAPHGSPFRVNARRLRRHQASHRVSEANCPVLFVNQVGGQDELVFDGDAFVMTPDGKCLQAPQFRDGIVRTEWEKTDRGWTCLKGPDAEDEDDLTSVYRAITLGTRDYVQKTGFRKVVLGLSGGIDSAMVAAIAVDALGPDNVHCVMLPSKYTSDHSLEDAKSCAEMLGVRYDTIPIEHGVGAMEQTLAPIFSGHSADVTEENLQSRLRGTILMALSNKFGSLLLTTGNKSEMAVGYATLYGDMNGAYNPLKDLYKTLVFDLARWRNANRPNGAMGPSGEVIPERIITKPPSAELRPDQKDEDSLPPYEVLDDILQGLVEDEVSVPAIVARGHDRETVEKIQRLLYIAEYKRRQAPPGPKITTRNFGRDRRYPIINYWHRHVSVRTPD